MQFRARFVKSIKQLSMMLPLRLRIMVGWWVLYLHMLRYRGSVVQCPCCGTKLSRFARNFTINLDNVMCPRCLSSSRHRLVYLYLQNKTNFFTDSLKVLHFSPVFIFQKLFQSQPNLGCLSADISSLLAMSTMHINIPIYHTMIIPLIPFFVVMFWNILIMIFML